MLMLISPAKKMDEAPLKKPLDGVTEPAFGAEIGELLKIMQRQTPKQLSKLMDISEKLAVLNHQRYQGFESLPVKPALTLFKGDVYQPIEVGKYGSGDYAFAQKHLRILSGLYGLLRPLDAMRPYRLEMGTALKNPKGTNLYAFWRKVLTEEINRLLGEGDGVLVNLASGEYFSALDEKHISGRVVTMGFREKRGNKLQNIGLLAKKARGMMVNYAILNRVEKVEGLRDFREEGYKLDDALSSDGEWVFVR